MRKLDNVMKIPALAALLVAGGAVGGYASLAAAQSSPTGDATGTQSEQREYVSDSAINETAVDEGR